MKAIGVAFPVATAKKKDNRSANKEGTRQDRVLFFLRNLTPRPRSRLKP